jgi:hypothetical protein
VAESLSELTQEQSQEWSPGHLPPRHRALTPKICPIVYDRDNQSEKGHGRMEGRGEKKRGGDGR